MDQSTKSEVMNTHPWVVLGESVDERPPRGVLDELGEPRGRLALLGEDGVRLLRVERLQDHVVQVVLDLEARNPLTANTVFLLLLLLHLLTCIRFDACILHLMALQFSAFNSYLELLHP